MNRTEGSIHNCVVNHFPISINLQLCFFFVLYFWSIWCLCWWCLHSQFKSRQFYLLNRIYNIFKQTKKSIWLPFQQSTRRILYCKVKLKCKYWMCSMCCMWKNLCFWWWNFVNSSSSNNFCFFSCYFNFIHF